MLTPYKYYVSDHMKLHNFIISFFEGIKKHRSGFKDSLIPKDFRDIAKTHKKVIYNRLKKIYEELVKLDAAAQTKFCERVILSNNIQQICDRSTIPLKLADIPKPIRQTILDLFLALYTQILRGDNTYSKTYGTIREHFNKFRELNSEITICPFCGIGELRNEFDTSMDQYDHFLPKTIYPLSSVNFMNLVPTCKDCNGLDCKADKDTLALGTEKIFFPYSQDNFDTDITFSVIKQSNIKDWSWSISITGRSSNLDEQITSWDKIYSIKSRYLAHVKGRMSKWAGFYNEFKRKALAKGRTEKEIQEIFVLYIETEEEFGLEYLRKPAFEAYFSSNK